MTVALPLFFIICTLGCVLKASLELDHPKRPMELLSPSGTWLLLALLVAMTGLTVEAVTL